MWKKSLNVAKTLSQSIKCYKSITLKINNKVVTAENDQKLIDIIKKNGFQLPPLICFHSDLPSSGGICRVCLVKDEKNPNNPIVSCKTLAKDGMEINTEDPVVLKYQQTNKDLMFNQHKFILNEDNKATKQKENLTNFHEQKNEELPIIINTATDNTSYIHFDSTKCITCNRCVQTCNYFHNIGVFGNVQSQKHFSSQTHAKSLTNQILQKRNFSSQIAHSKMMIDNECIQCGQCINRCPTDALTEHSEIEDVLKHIKDPSKTVVFMTAPAIRVSIGEEFGYKPGEKIIKGQLVEGLKKLGSNVQVLDVDFSADLTIVEEGYELIERFTRNLTGLKRKGGEHVNIELPMFTSCCPGWVCYMEKNYPQLLNHLSSCKSPQNMLGAVEKNFWEKTLKKDPKNLIVVTIMPCTAKKYETDRNELKVNNLRDIDYSITTRECAKLLKMNDINIRNLNGVDFDQPFGFSTGAGVIFGSTGGVMEAALRTAYNVITGDDVPFKKLDILPVRGFDGIKEASIQLPSKMAEGYEFLANVNLKIGVAHGLTNAQKLVNLLLECKQKKQVFPYHFIEVMACPGGCIGGGGQPKPTNQEVRSARANLIYQEDKNCLIRKSHENPQIIQLYKDLLKEPLGPLSHKLLHTHYISKPVQLNRFINDHSENQATEIEQLLNLKFPQKEEKQMMQILHTINDQYGYLSEAAILQIAKHLKQSPIHIYEIVSGYNYLNLKPCGENKIFICHCLNCQLKGSKLLQQKLEETFGIKMGQTTPDGKYSLHHSAWLGWCVNNSPGIMVKRMNDEYIIPMGGFDNLFDIDKLTISNYTFDPKTPNHIQYYPYTRFDKNNISFQKEYSINDAIQKAMTLGPDNVIEEIKKSKLQGRGGGGFPSYIKMNAVKQEEADEKYIICNADEGLPSAFKDYLLLQDQKTRENVITGMCIAAHTVGSEKAYIYLKYEYRNLIEEIKDSIQYVKQQEDKFQNIEFEIVLGAGPYIAGEETALFNSIEGKPCKPRTDRNYFPTQNGLFNKPTLINNVETFSCIPMILCESAEKWSQIKATDSSKECGLKIYNIVGDCIKNSIYMEYPVGVTLETILDELKIKDQIQCVEVGGSTEPLTFPKDFNKKIGFSQDGKTLGGVGSIVLFNKDRNILDIYKNKFDFMERESCQQCVPCREASKIFCHVLGKFSDQANEEKVSNIIFDKKLKEFAEVAMKTSICAHGKALGKQYLEMTEQLKKK